MDIQTVLSDLKLNGKVIPVVGGDVNQTYRIKTDQRAYFLKIHPNVKKDFFEAGLKMNFVQDNESKSKKGVLRGLHFQIQNTQGKLVRVTQGEVYDVAVDLRKGSPTYGQYEGVVLSEENKRQLYIPEGFAHGFLVLSDTATFVYKCTDFYNHNAESGILWNDPTLNIDWPIKDINEIILSDKDKLHPTFKEFNSPFKYKGDLL